MTEEKNNSNEINWRFLQTDMSFDGIPEKTGDEAKGKAEELAWSLPLGQITKAVFCGKELPL